MLHCFHQNGLYYVYLFRSCKATAFLFISRMFLKNILLLVLKKKLFSGYDYLFYLRLQLLTFSFKLFQANIEPLQGIHPLTALLGVPRSTQLFFKFASTKHYLFTLVVSADNVKNSTLIYMVYVFTWYTAIYGSMYKYLLLCKSFLLRKRKFK